MAYEPVNVDTVTGTGTFEPVNIDEAATPVSNRTVDERAVKASFGMSELTNKTEEDYKQGLLAGNENTLRNEAAHILTNQRWLDFQRRSAGFIGPAEWNEGIRAVTTPMDTRSIFETEYNNKYLSHVNLLNAIHDAKGFAQQALNLREYGIKKINDVQDVIDNQGIFGRGWDILKGALPFYQELQTREGWGLIGNDTQQEIINLSQLPFHQQKDYIDKKVDGMMSGVAGGNPIIAARWLHYLIGASASDTNLDNLSSIATLLDIGQFTKLGVGVARSIALRRAGYRAARSAAQTVGAIPERAPEVVAPAAAGDLKTAAVNQATMDATNLLRGVEDPISMVKNGLQSSMKFDRSIATSSPGNFGAGMTNRLTEDWDKFIDSFTNAVGNLATVNRTPGFLQNKTAVEMMAEETIARRFRGSASEHVLNTDIVPIPEQEGLRLKRADLLKDQFGNTRSFNIYIGKETGEMWNSPNALKNWMDRRGFVPARETLMDQINKQFGIEVSKLDKQIKDLSAIVKEGPGMDADVHGMNLWERQSKELETLRRKYDDLLAWHADKMTEPGINDIVMKETPGGYTINKVPGVGTASTKPGFKTSKGSFYELHEDGTTTRDKAKRPEHKDFGPQPKSDKTYYLTEEQQAAFSKDRKVRAADYSTTPVEGSYPLEIWKKQGNQTAFHLGNKITEMTGADNPSYTIHQQGDRWYATVRLPLTETSSTVRTNLFGSPSSEVPRSLAKDFAGEWRTSEEYLSPEHRANRKIVAYNTDGLLQVLFENAKNIRDLARGVIKEDPVTGEKINWFKRQARGIVANNRVLGGNHLYDDWLRVVDIGRRMIDPATGLEGRFFKTEYELSHAYQTIVGRVPDPIEIRAYFDFFKHYSADHAFLELQLYKNMHRNGIMSHALSALDPEGKTLDSPFFHAKLLKRRPGGRDNTILIMGRTWEDANIVKSQALSPKLAEELDKAIENGGRQALEIYNVNHRPLEGIGPIKDQRIRYVITYGPAKVKELTLGDGSILPKRGGGHVQYNYTTSIKQAMIRPEEVGNHIEHNYEGDALFGFVKNRQEGHEFLKHLNQVRDYLDKGSEADAARYVSAHLPFDWSELKPQFTPQKDLRTGKINPPRFNTKEPFHLLDEGQHIGDIDNAIRERYNYNDPKTGELKNSFRDRTRGGSLAAQFQHEFIMPRDAQRVMALNGFNELHPKGLWEPAEMVDPMVTMTRSINRIAEGVFLDDYKNAAVEHWIRRAGPHLNLHDDPESELQSFPYRIFYKHEYHKDTPRSTVSSLEAEYWAIKNLIGIPSEGQATLHEMSQRMADSLYNKIGGKGRVYLAPSWMLENIPNSALFARTFAHHATMGFWSLPQVISQNMNYVTMAGIAGPVKATQASVATALHQAYRIAGNFTDVDKLAFFDNMAAKTGLWKPGEWAEATKNLTQRTSFRNVGKENVMLETSYQPKIVYNAFGNFVNAGDVIFKGSERNARIGAWYIAHKEARDATPVGRFTDDDIRGILNRADDLNGNMSKASRSKLQTGFGAFPFQMMGYNMRLAEMFTGTRVSPADRIRMATTWGLMFGFPNAANLTGFPAGDYLRQYALENGYVVGDRFWSSLLMEGIPSSMIAMMSGRGDWTSFDYDDQGNLINHRMRTGQFVNIGGRFGSPGIDVIRDALNGDKKFMDMMFGVTGSVFKTMAGQLAPIRLAYAPEFLGGDKSGQFKTQPEDLLGPLKAFSSYSYAWRAGAAIHTGDWLSKNEEVLKRDVSPLAAVLMSMTGTQPQEAHDAFYKGLAVHDSESRQKFAFQQFIKDYRRFIQAQKDGDPDAPQYYRNAQAWAITGGLSEEYKQKAYRAASKGWEDAIEQADRRLFGDVNKVMNEKSLWNTITGGPDKRDVAIDTNERIRALQAEREGRK